MSRATCPYNALPDQAFWKRSVAGVPYGAVNPVSEVPFVLQRGERVATAGSCFAQHIARYMANAGFPPFLTEAPPYFSTPRVAAQFQYGTYSARYGNIYTTRQLLQLFLRAFGELIPVDEAWEKNGRWYDPYRPSVQPGGYHSIEELQWDQRQHLAAVRRLFSELDVFIYTLGLTEAWVNRRDGLVYPVAPGCGWGEYRDEEHEFVNFGVNEVADDLSAFVRKLRAVNSRAKIILTVSPVPLVATAERRHVLESTVLSKSVLRVATEMVRREHDDVAYFPSYELITGSFSRGRYFGDDLRSVREEGVAHVMRTFFSAYMPGLPIGDPGQQGSSARTDGCSRESTDPEEGSGVLAAARAITDVICEEDVLDAGRRDL